MTPNMFLNQLETAHKVEMKKLKDGDTTYMEHLAAAMGLMSTGINNTETDIFDQMDSDDDENGDEEGEKS